MRRALSNAFAVGVLAALAGCFGSSSGGSLPSAAFDAAGVDVTLPGDGSPDVAPSDDASMEAEAAAVPESSVDAPSVDSGAPDATADAVDAVAEAMTAEAGLEAAADAPVDAAGDGNTCGNGIITGGQICNGANLGGATCTSVVSATTGGTLMCSSDCMSYDLSSCTCGIAGYTACTSPANGCFDLQNDTNNCGACGVSCGSGNACTVGHCTTVLMTGTGVQMNALGLAVDGTRAYFANTFDWNIYAVPLTGGPPVAMMATPVPGGGDQLTVTPSWLYWTQHFQGVFKVAIGGGTAITISSSEVYPTTIVNDGTDVFWANTASPFSIVQDVIATDTVTTVPIVVDAGAGLSGIQPMVVDANHIYWGDTVGAGNGTVYQANRDGSGVIALASGLSASVNGIAVDASNVYFTVDPGNNSVNSVPIGGGSVNVLATGEAGPIPIVTDGTSLYWINTGGIGTGPSSLRKMPVGGGAITNLAACGVSFKKAAPCGDSFVSLAMDSTYVYWTDEAAVTPGGSGTLFKVAK